MQASIGGSSSQGVTADATPSLPCSLADLLITFAPCFTAPTFATFRAMVAGFLTQPGPHTVTGMLAGAGLAGRRHHDLAYRFFATARWSADQLGLLLLDLICAVMVPADAPLYLAVDDTLWRRTGRKLHGAAWHHDTGGPGRHRPAWGSPATQTAPRWRWPASWSTCSSTTSASGQCTWSATPPTSANHCGDSPHRSP